MCSNYMTVTRADRLLTYFGVERDRKREPSPEDEMYPLRGMAPFIRLAQDGSGNKRVDDGIFGLLPRHAKELAYGRKYHTFNARSETVATKPSFREAWEKGQRCVIPAEWIYEPHYPKPVYDVEGNVVADGPSIRHRIQRTGGYEPLRIAGIWWDNESLLLPDGRPTPTFAMLTVNAAGHPVFSLMHRPRDEKRMPIFLDDVADDDRWLTATVEGARAWFRQWSGALEHFPDPRAARRKKGDSPEADEGATPGLL